MKFNRNLLRQEMKMNKSKLYKACLRYLYSQTETGTVWPRSLSFLISTNLSVFDIPFGFVPGDHDYEADANEMSMLSFLSKTPLSVAT